MELGTNISKPFNLNVFPKTNTTQADLVSPINHKLLGGGNSNIFYFHPYLGKWSNLTSIFFKWVVQPPTRLSYGNKSDGKGWVFFWQRNGFHASIRSICQSSRRKNATFWRAQSVQNRCVLGGGNSNIFLIFTPTWGRWTHFDEHIFQLGWNMLKPPTRFFWCWDLIALKTLKFVFFVDLDVLGKLRIRAQEELSHLSNESEVVIKYVNSATGMKKCTPCPSNYLRNTKLWHVNELHSPCVKVQQLVSQSSHQVFLFLFVKLNCPGCFVLASLLPIASMGRTVYLPTWMVDFYGKWR